jgi:hypothetical protein
MGNRARRSPSPVGLHEVAFLPRHGLSHEFSPHTVPYRANMWALRALGVRRMFAPCAVGSLTAELGPGRNQRQQVRRVSCPASLAEVRSTSSFRPLAALQSGETGRAL